MKYRLVIFDFDGTLADTFPWFVSVFDRVADQYHFRRVDKSEVELFRALSGREIVKRLGIPVWRLPFVASHMRKLIARDISQVPLFPGAGELLQRLAAAGVTLAVVTSNSEANARRVLGPESSALISRFECSVSAFRKAARFRRVLRATGIPASDALCIGDEIRDLEAARQVGVRFGAVTWGFTAEHALAAREPTHLFRSMSEIADVVR